MSGLVGAAFTKSPTLPFSHGAVPQFSYETLKRVSALSLNQRKRFMSNESDDRIVVSCHPAWALASALPSPHHAALSCAPIHTSHHLPLGDYATAEICLNYISNCISLH